MTAKPKKRWQFSLTTLGSAIALVAVACVAIPHASDGWATAMFSITVFLLMFSLLGVIYARQEARAFWVGFAVFGVGYIAITCGPWFNDKISPRIATTQILRYVHAELNPRVMVVGARRDGRRVLADGRILTEDELLKLVAARPKLQDVESAGHALFDILFALLGGVAARWFYWRHTPAQDHEGN